MQKKMHLSDIYKSFCNTLQQEVTVADVRNHKLSLMKGSGDDPQQRRTFENTATVGKPLTTTCMSRGTDPVANLSMTINGEDIEDMRGGRVQERVVTRDGGKIKVTTAYLDTVTEDDFDDNDIMILECTGKIRDHLLKKKSMAFKKVGAERFEANALRRGKYAPHGWDQDHDQQPRRGEENSGF